MNNCLWNWHNVISQTLIKNSKLKTRNVIFYDPKVKIKTLKVGDRVKIYLSSGLISFGRKIYYRGNGEVIEIGKKGEYRISGYINEPVDMMSYDYCVNPNKDVNRLEINNILINPRTMKQIGISFYFIQ